MRVLLVVGALPFFLLIPVFGTLYPIYAKDEFAAGPTGLGLLLTAVGVGGTLGGFIANALGRAERQGLHPGGVGRGDGRARSSASPLSPSLAVAVAFSVHRRRGRDGACLEQHGDAADVGAGGDARAHLQPASCSTRR